MVSLLTTASLSVSTPADPANAGSPGVSDYKAAREDHVHKAVAPTQAPGDNTTKIATTAFVTTAISAAAYLLPIASAGTLGGVKIGANVAIAGDGTISVAAPYTLPVATGSVLGGVKVGTGLTVDGAGLIATAYGTTGTTACAGNDSRLSDSRPASDVSAWAKAGTKPSYTYTEVGAEAALGNPGVNGYVLSSTTGGVRSWVAMTGSGFDPASPGPIGGTTPATGAFTTLTLSGSIKTNQVIMTANSGIYQNYDTAGKSVAIGYSTIASPANYGGVVIFDGKNGVLANFIGGTGLTINATTASTSSTTGALTVAGGLGVGGQISAPYFTASGTVSSVQASTIIMDANSSHSQRVLSIGPNTSTKGTFKVDLYTSDVSSGLTAIDVANTGVVSIPGTTTTTSSTTGALVVSGGIGVGGGLNVGSYIQAGSQIAVIASSSYPAFNAYVALDTTIVQIWAHTASHAIDIRTSGTGRASVGTSTVTPLDIVYNGSAQLTITNGLVTAINSMAVSGATASTSSTTGALTVAGGVGIGGRLSIGGILYFNPASGFVGMGTDGSSNLNLYCGAGSQTRLSISQAGVATFSDSVAIGNAVSSSGTMTANRRVTMVIGGVTHYVLASTV